MSTITGNVHNPATNAHETEGLVELLNPESSRQRLYSAEVDQAGHYNLQGIDEGSYLLFCSVWGADTKYYWEIPVTIKDDQTNININLLADTAQTLL